MSDTEKLRRFLAAMAGQWVVDSYGVNEETGKLVVRYRSVLDSAIQFSHEPYGDLNSVPKVGCLGWMGFISDEMAKDMRAAPK